MFTPTLSSLTRPATGVLEPMQELNQQALASVEKLTARQIESLQIYTDLGIGQLKAAAAVRDVEGLQTLVSKQRDVRKAATERLVADAKAFVEMATESLSEVTKPSAETVAPEKSKAA